MGVPFNGCEDRHVLRYPRQATFHPLKYLAGVAEACSKSGVEFFRCDLSNTNFQRALLRNANFRMANINGAKFSGADMGVAILRETDLTGADLSGVDLSTTLMPRNFPSAKSASAQAGTKSA